MLDPKVRNKMQKMTHKKILKNAKKKVVPYMKNLVRVNTGSLKKTIRAETEEVQGNYVTRVIAGDDQVTYAKSLELRIGLFKDDTSFGQRFDELAKMLND